MNTEHRTPNTEGSQLAIDEAHIIVRPAFKPIGEMAFHKRQYIQSMEIPESATVIDQPTFSCSVISTP